MGVFIYQSKHYGLRYVASAKRSGKRIHIGTFDSEDEARAAIDRFNAKYPQARLGRRRKQEP